MTYRYFLIALITLLLFSCSRFLDSDPDPVDVTGTVFDPQGEVLEGATVSIISPEPEESTVTNQEGIYQFTRFFEEPEDYTLEVSHEQFQGQTLEFTVDPANISFPDVQMESTGNDNNNDENDDPEPEDLGEPASIHLESVSSESVGVKGTMQREDSQITFLVRDEFGNPLTNNNSVEVEFSFGNHPDGGESLSPTSVTTDSNGEATTTLTSGTVSGTVQIVATVTFENEDEETIELTSKPVAVVIHAGLPDQDHFTVAVDREDRNVAFGNTGRKVTVTAYAGDRYGNNVPEGTMVYFTTDGGYIEGSSPVNSAGEATVELTVANPLPPAGIATITASTSDDQEQRVEEQTQVIFSQDPIIEISPDDFDLDNGEDQTFEYTVMDAEGNPMVPGTSITVTVEGEDIEVIGDVDIDVGSPNSDFSNFEELTEYTFNFRDSDTDTDEDSPVQITIEVEGENGTARKVITG